MADIWIMGEMIVEVMRIEEGVPLDRPGLFKGPFPSGAPAIFIDTAARLGHSAGIIGGVGKDDFGKNILDRLKGDGVDCSHVLESDTGATGVAFVTYFSDGSRKFIFHMGNTPAAEAKMPEKEVLKGVRFFHVMGCSLSSNRAFGKEILGTMKLAKSLGAKISFDPNIRKELMHDEEVSEIISEVMANTNIFLPGVDELLQITGKSAVEEAAAACFENPELEILVLKNGSRGCSIYTREGKSDISAYSIEPVDATGAGDCFDGAFICGLLEGKDLMEAARMASAAGALNTMAFGPMEGRISPDSVKAMMEGGKHGKEHKTGTKEYL